MNESVESITARLRDRWGLPDNSELKCESSATSKIVTWDGVLLVFNAEGLSGYLFGPKPSDPITPVGEDLQTASTVEGLGLGQSVADARKIYGIKFVLDETSLGPEWYIDDPKGYPLLRGFASGLAKTDTITHIGAGDLCAVR
jgi:hypothetical protein